MSLNDFRSSAPSEWGHAPDLAAAAEEALERSIWLREHAQALANYVGAALGHAWQAAEMGAPLPYGAGLERVPAVHVQLLEPYALKPAGALLCRVGCAPGLEVRRAPTRADGNGEAYEPAITCRNCLATLSRLSPSNGPR